MISWTSFLADDYYNLSLTFTPAISLLNCLFNTGNDLKYNNYKWFLQLMFPWRAS